MMQAIPDHWSPEQALAVIETLEVLTEQIWSTYGDAIAHDLYGPPPVPLEFPQQLELPLARFPLDDEISF